MKPANPIILALDYDNLNDARQMVSLVRPYVGMLKVGLELFTACGKESLELSRDFNIPLFLDLKLHDVPLTVSKTVQVLCSQLARYHGPHFVSIHTLGGQEMCHAAWDVSLGSNVEIVGITVLTSLGESELASFGFRDSRVGVRATRLANLGVDCSEEHVGTGSGGLNHFVCPPAQLKLMREHLGNDLVLISPGIRLPEAVVDDHKRPTTIGHALKNGATWVVIGRPITKDHDPLQAAIYFKEQADKY